MRKKRFLAEPLALLFVLGLVVCDRSGIALMTVLAAALHECGHLLAARLLHIPLQSMRLDLLGARLEVGGRAIGYGEEWLLAAAGPLASLLSSIVAAPLWGSGRHAVIFSCASLLLGVLNLLPIRTLDGGRMLESFLLCHTSVRVAHAVLATLSFLFLFLLWAVAVYFLLRVGDGLSLLCFSMSFMWRFFKSE
ncbi:MAG: hypothetical protein IJY39_02490 [Clostridia bacterium]|nr:hypothetical protein [Clostridia bacterium]MBQ9785191.1 hypothetical protein [Clostridia bacterium]